MSYLYCGEIAQANKQMLANTFDTILAKSYVFLGTEVLLLGKFLLKFCGKYFSFGNRKKWHGVKSGEHGGWSMVFLRFLLWIQSQFRPHDELFSRWTLITVSASFCVTIYDTLEFKDLITTVYQYIQLCRK